MMTYENDATNQPFSKACNVCYKTFSWSLSFKDHMLLHSEQFPSECRACYLRFVDDGELGGHIKSTHMTFAKHDISLTCESTFGVWSDPHVRNYSCVECKIDKFSSWQRFEAHIRTHLRDPKVQVEKLSKSTILQHLKNTCKRTLSENSQDPNRKLKRYSGDIMQYSTLNSFETIEAEAVSGKSHCAARSDSSGENKGKKIDEEKCNLLNGPIYSLNVKLEDEMSLVKHHSVIQNTKIVGQGSDSERSDIKIELFELMTQDEDCCDVLTKQKEINDPDTKEKSIEILKENNIDGQSFEQSVIGNTDKDTHDNEDITQNTKNNSEQLSKRPNDDYTVKALNIPNGQQNLVSETKSFPCRKQTVTANVSSLSSKFSTKHLNLDKTVTTSPSDVHLGQHLSTTFISKTDLNENEKQHSEIQSSSKNFVKTSGNHIKSHCQSVHEVRVGTPPVLQQPPLFQQSTDSEEVMQRISSMTHCKQVLKSNDGVQPPVQHLLKHDMPLKVHVPPKSFQNVTLPSSHVSQYKSVNGNAQEAPLLNQHQKQQPPLLMSGFPNFQQALQSHSLHRSKMSLPMQTTAHVMQPEHQGQQLGNSATFLKSSNQNSQEYIMGHNPRVQQYENHEMLSPNIHYTPQNQEMGQNPRPQQYGNHEILSSNIYYSPQDQEIGQNSRVQQYENQEVLSPNIHYSPQDQEMGQNPRVQQYGNHNILSPNIHYSPQDQEMGQNPQVQQYRNHDILSPNIHYSPQDQEMGQNPPTMMYNNVNRLNQRGNPYITRYPVFPTHRHEFFQGYPRKSSINLENSPEFERPEMAPVRGSSYNLTPQRHISPLMNIQQPISVQDSIQKSHIMSTHHCPVKQQKMDIDKHAKQNDIDCQFNVRRQDEGFPVIQNVESAISTSSFSSISQPQSPIDLTTSNNLVVQIQAENMDSDQTKKSDAINAASFITTSANTVAHIKHRRKQTLSVRPEFENLSPSLPQIPVTTMTLNSASSVNPAVAKQLQQPQQQHNNAFTVPSASTNRSGNKQTRTQNLPHYPSLLRNARRTQVPSFNSHTISFMCQLCGQHLPSSEAYRQHMLEHLPSASRQQHSCHLCVGLFPFSLKPGPPSDFAIAVVNMRHPDAKKSLKHIGVRKVIPLNQL